MNIGGAASAAERWSPWAPSDLVRWTVLTVLGHAAWIAGWWFAASQSALDAQLPGAALSVAGCVTAAAADVSWLVRGCRLVRRRVPTAIGPSSPSPSPVATADAGEPVVVGPVGAFFHRPDCPFAVGKGWAPVARGSQPVADRRPCPACRP